MIWFKKKQRQPEELTVSNIVFLGEQDGVPEQKFKSAINDLSRKNENIISVYLARVDYGNPNEFNIALCIRSKNHEDIGLKKELGQVFSALFGTHEHLDIVFLRKEQEDVLRKECMPFYTN